MYDLIIIGAGPAGLTAGLYAARFGMHTLILEKNFVGGQIILSPTIENFPGFPGGIKTGVLIEKMQKQVEDLGVKISLSEVLKIESGRDARKVFTQDETLEARTVLIASGAYPKKLGVAGEDKFIGRGVSYCGTCDGPLFKDKEICVVGGGDRALEEAIFLTTYAKKVNLIHRREEFRGSDILKKEVGRNKKINIILESVVEEILGEKKVSGVKIKNIKDNRTTQVGCEGVFIFAGIHPNTDFLKSLLQLDKDGFIITDQEMNSSVKGIFAAGDCRHSPLWQVVTACSDGAIAAHSAHRFIAPYR
ncbi:MAG: thioredoxin-disulfide reductase [Candidatus Omnitrophica bacterium]|nr:thioredoxin-disulfide reductase [Candidatus Omnitrophota bacterium]MDD5236347.1 thioredoxin-disulfide reductase [Candidatus Omnitrophota bacterium]MDD5610229.1 thioredoxin-disulfide reductase [Candidatus Omnitrophota bacterium]